MVSILIIDDAMILRARLRNILTANGYNVVGEADNGLIGIRKYQELQPDIVTLDITMPGIGGIETLKKIRQIDPQASVIILSALSQKLILLEAVRNGALNFITKPFADENLLKIIQDVSKSIAANKQGTHESSP